MIFSAWYHHCCCPPKRDFSSRVSDLVLGHGHDSLTLDSHQVLFVVFCPCRPAQFLFMYPQYPLASQCRIPSAPDFTAPSGGQPSFLPEGRKEEKSAFTIDFSLFHLERPPAGENLRMSRTTSVGDPVVWGGRGKEDGRPSESANDCPITFLFCLGGKWPSL